MCNRPLWKLSFYVIIVGILAMSLGYNLYLTECICRLESSLQSNNWVTDYELIKVKTEIGRLNNLSNQEYNTTGE